MTVRRPRKSEHSDAAETLGQADAQAAHGAGSQIRARCRSGKDQRFYSESLRVLSESPCPSAGSQMIGTFAGMGGALYHGCCAPPCIGKNETVENIGKRGIACGDYCAGARKTGNGLAEPEGAGE